MNYRILCKIHGIILAALGGAMACCLPVALWLDEPAQRASSVTGFTLIVLLISGISALALRITRNAQAVLYAKEALATVGTGWLAACVAGALPYWLLLPDISFVDAFFESASGFTTTGASVIPDLEKLPASLHLWRAMSQWLGGLGVVVFFVAILTFLGAASKVLFSLESSAKPADFRTSRMQSGILQLTALYIGISILCAVALRICGMNGFDSVLHAFTTVSTGGFSNRPGSIADFASPAIEWTIIVFMALGGTSFVLMLDAINGRSRSFLKSSEFKAYMAILLSASTAIWLILMWHSGWQAALLETLRNSTFTVVSLMTTTGFSTADFDQWLPVTHVLLLLLMVIGGSSGSTSGGAKVVRMLVAAKLSLQQVEQAYRPNVVRPLVINGRNLASTDLQRIMAYLILLGMVFFASLCWVSMMETHVSFEGIVSMTAASLFNIGPGFAEVGPSRNFAGLHDYTKVFLAFLMIMGRIELFAFLALISPALWKKF